jgi:hypothetical protein
LRVDARYVKLKKNILRTQKNILSKNMKTVNDIIEIGKS